MAQAFLLLEDAFEPPGNGAGFLIRYLAGREVARPGRCLPCIYYPVIHNALVTMFI